MERLIGYQIVSNDGYNEIPDGFYSFVVIRDFSTVVEWFKNEKENPENGRFRWVALPIFEGDIEEPTFIESL